MDIASAALAAFALVVVLVVGVRFVSAWESLSRERVETERLKAAWYQQYMSKTNPKTNGKSSKKKDKDEEDEEGEADDLDVLIEAARPFKAMVGGYMQAKNMPVDVERLFEHDAGEKAKVATFLTQRAANGSQQQGAAWAVQVGG